MTRGQHYFGVGQRTAEDGCATHNQSQQSGRPERPPTITDSKSLFLYFLGVVDCSGVGGVCVVGGVPLVELGLALVGVEPLSGCGGVAWPEPLLLLEGEAALPLPVTVMRSTTLRLPA